MTINRAQLTTIAAQATIILIYAERMLETFDDDPVTDQIKLLEEVRHHAKEITRVAAGGKRYG